ncbi:PTS transporter subunit EIIB [Staphylococcus borealis]|uniref:PTS transporter subunit EIIB n=1 Tax=Staphylococcus borealis TaxID=2742203 RepID=UPI0039C70A3F
MKIKNHCNNYSASQLPFDVLKQWVVRNIKHLDACITRLRVEVNENQKLMLRP